MLVAAQLLPTVKNRGVVCNKNRAALDSSLSPRSDGAERKLASAFLFLAPGRNGTTHQHYDILGTNEPMRSRLWSISRALTAR